MLFCFTNLWTSFYKQSKNVHFAQKVEKKEHIGFKTATEQLIRTQLIFYIMLGNMIHEEIGAERDLPTEPIL